MVDGIKISELPASLLPSLGYEFPAIKDNVTQRLSVQQVADLIMNLILDGAPGALDTLNELAAALGDDPNFATTVSTAIAARLKLDGTTAMTGALNMGGHDIQNVSNLVGMVGLFVATSPPPGWLKMNGALLTRASYPALWAYAQASGALVTDAAWATATGSFSSGDGSTTFRLPDARGEFPRFFSDGSTVDSGRVLGSNQGDAIRNITGSFTGSTNAVRFASSTGVFTLSSPGTSDTGNGAGTGSGVVNFAANNQVPTASENRPRNIALLPCIKY